MNPVPIMVVEIINGDQTSEATNSSVVEAGKSGKIVYLQ